MADSPQLNTTETPPSLPSLSNAGLLLSQKAGELYRKKNVGDDQNLYVAYASMISNNDEDFLKTLNQENGLWTIDRQSDRKGDNGYYDYGFCQFNEGHHPDTVHDPRFFTDPFWQLDQCWDHYKAGTTFYGYRLRHNSDGMFILQSTL